MSKKPKKPKPKKPKKKQTHMPLFARPDGDQTVGNWTPTPSSPTTLWDKIDETPFSDTDFVQSENDPSNDIMEVTLENQADPASSTGHIVRYRLARAQSGGGQPGTLNIIVGLYQSTTLVATATHSNIGLGFAEFSFTLTGPEADAITDYDDLRIRFDADKSAGARTTWCELSHAEFETPSAAAVLDMVGWRWRDDEFGLNVDDGWLAAENVNPATDDLELRRRLRVEVEETGGVADTDGFKIQYNLNSGGWNDAVATPLDWSTRTTLDEVEAMQSKQYVDKAAASTSLLTTSGATFDPDGDGVGETGVTGTDVAIAADQVVELEFCILVHRIFDGPAFVDDGDTIEFRVVRDDGTVLDAYPTLPQITVNEPAGMLGGVYPENPGELGPFEDGNGNKYALIEPTGQSAISVPVALKSADGDNWDEQDGAGRPGTADVEGFHVIQDAANKQLLAFHHRGSVVRLHTFNTSDHATAADEWDSTDVDIDNGAHTDGSEQQITAQIRSDGTIVAAWTGDTSTDKEVWVNIRSAGGTWGTAFVLWDLSSNDIEGVVSVLGDNDHVYLFCVDQPTGDLLGKRINGSDDSIEDLFGTGVAATVPGTVVFADVGTDSDSRQGVTMPLYWNDGADKIFVVWKNATTDDFEGRVITVGGGGSLGTVGDPINDSEDGANSFGGSRQPILSIVRDSSDDFHAFFAKEPTAGGSLNNVLLHAVSTDDGATWGTNETVTLRSPMSRINWIRAHIQPDGAVGLLYDNASGTEQNNDVTGGDDDLDDGGLGAGFVWYDEFVIAVGPVANSLTSGGGEDADSFATASITPTADALVLVGVDSTFDTTVPAQPTLTGCGMTWEVVRSFGYDDSGTTRRLTLFRSLHASPSTGVLTFDFASEEQTSCIWSVVEFDPVNTGGTNGSAAVVQDVQDPASIGADTTIAAVLAAFADPDNTTYGVASKEAPGDGDMAGDGNMTDLHNVTVSGGDRLLSQWVVGAELTVDWSWGTSRRRVGFAVEIATAGGGADVTLSGSGNAAADGNADLDVIVELAGGGDAASEGSADFTVEVLLSGSGNAASAGSATLIEHTFLAGSGDVAADGDAAASIAKGLSGSGNAASEGQAALEEATFLAGGGDAASDGNAALTRTRGLVGAGDTASDGNAAFDVVVFIAGAGDVAASGSASLDIDVFLVGAGDVAADASAVLNVDYVLAGAGDAASEGQATLEEATFLSGAGDVASEGVGTLDVSLSVSGTGNAAADGNAVLNIEVLIAGGGDAASEGTAAANVTKGLVGSGNAAADGDAVLGTIALLSGSGNAASAGSATLEEATFLAGSGNAAADGDAAASITRLLVGSGNAASQGQATLEEATFLSGSGNAAADGDAAASIARLLAGAGDAASDGSADFTIGAETLLSGAGDVASDGNAAASIQKGLSGAGDVAADGDAAASIEKGLVGAGDAASEGQATLIEHTFLAGSGDAASEGVGTLSIGAEVLLSGSGNAASDASAPLTVEILIAGGGDAAADGNAAASIEKGLAGSGNAASEGQATLEEATFLSGSGNSASEARSSLTVEVNIAGRGNAASIGSAAILTSTFLAGGGDASADGSGALGLILAPAGSGVAAAIGRADLSVFIKAKLIQPVDSTEYDPSRETRKPRTAVTASVEGRIG